MSKYCETRSEVWRQGPVTSIHVSYTGFSRALCLIGRLIKVKWKRHLLHYRARAGSIKSNHISEQASPITWWLWFSRFETVPKEHVCACRYCNTQLDGWALCVIFSVLMWKYKVLPLNKCTAFSCFKCILWPSTKSAFNLLVGTQHKKQSFPLVLSKKFMYRKYLVSAGRNIEILVRLLRCLTWLSHVLCWLIAP